MLTELLGEFESLTHKTERFDLGSLRSSFDNVDNALNSVEEVLGSLRSWEAPLATEVASHLVNAGGKRLRPALLFLTFRAADGDDLERTKPYAVACELIHTSTLLHDDVIDQGNERRGVKTANRRFGNLNAVLSGDYLVAHVMEQLLSLEPVEPARHLAMVMTQLVQGEILQEEYSYDPGITEEQYIRATQLKTSSLFSYAAWCGAFLADSNRVSPDDFASYAEHLGIAFQIVDDVLDYESQETGKTPLSDLKDGKMNFPLILAKRQDRELSGMLHSLDGREGIESDRLEEIHSKVLETNALEDSREEARKRSSMARACLDDIEDNPYKEALEKISRFVYERIQ